ncbi:hypothetical protein [Methanopyrus sp.]
MIHTTLWIVLAGVCLVLAGIALVSAIVVEGTIEATTWFTVADLAVCAAAIYVGITGHQFSSLLPTVGLIIATLMAVAHVTYTWVKGIVRLVTGRESKSVGERPDTLRAFLTRVLERFGYKGKVDPGDREAARRVLETCRKWGWDS